MFNISTNMNHNPTTKEKVQNKLLQVCLHIYQRVLFYQN